MKYAAAMLFLFFADRVLLRLFPFSEEACRYATLGLAMVGVAVLVANEIKASRTVIE
jgi:hypothetical protein